MRIAAPGMADFECPHCHVQLEDEDDIIDWYGPSTWNETHVRTCPSCGKDFAIRAEVSATYTTSTELPKPPEPVTPSPYRHRTFIPLSQGCLVVDEGLPTKAVSSLDEALRLPRELRS